MSSLRAATDAKSAAALFCFLHLPHVSGAQAEFTPGEKVMHKLLPFTRKALVLYAPDDPPAGGNPPPDPPDGEGEKKTFTQKELDALFAQRGKQGASQREKELLESLGV